jgi:hypothetical protein
VDDIVDNEQRHYLSCQEGSKEHARQSPGSNIQVSGSNSKQDQAGNENIAFSNVFEVYHYSHKGHTVV